MIHRCFAVMGTLAAVIAVLSLAPVSVAGQAPTAAAKTWTPTRTPDGQPDLQGVWTFKTITPLERPKELAGKPVLTDEEVAAFEAQENRRQNRDLIDSAKGGLNYVPGGVVPYNEFWYDRGNKMTGSRRTSLVVDPPDGRIPPRTPEAQQRLDDQAAASREDQLGQPRADNPEDRDVSDRCITNGLPRLPGAYNNQILIVQTPGQVAIEIEMHHHGRMIPLDGRPHLPQAVRQWLGDSRGRWEGNTLVVDVTNFNDKGDFRGSGKNLHLVERYTRVDADTINYEVTVDDPTTWTRPWTIAFPLTKLQDQVPHMFEYACHEGNYSLAGILAGARIRDKAAAGVAKKGSR